MWENILFSFSGSGGDRRVRCNMKFEHLFTLFGYMFNFQIHVLINLPPVLLVSGIFNHCFFLSSISFVDRTDDWRQYEVWTFKLRHNLIVWFDLNWSLITVIWSLHIHNFNFMCVTLLICLPLVLQRVQSTGDKDKLKQSF